MSILTRLQNTWRVFTETPKRTHRPAPLRPGSPEFHHLMESHGLTSSSATEFTDAQARAVMSRILASRTSNEAKDAALYALEVKVENQNPRGMANPILTEIHNAQYKLLDKDGWK